jgi:hypothetical protein
MGVQASVRLARRRGWRVRAVSPREQEECPAATEAVGGGGGAVYAGVPEIGTWLPFAYMHWTYITCC